MAWYLVGLRKPPGVWRLETRSGTSANAIAFASGCPMETFESSFRTSSLLYALWYLRRVLKDFLEVPMVLSFNMRQLRRNRGSSVPDGLGDVFCQAFMKYWVAAHATCCQSPRCTVR